MRIKITEIEATADELRQSNSLADGLMNTLRGAFNFSSFGGFSTGKNEEDEEDED